MIDKGVCNKGFIWNPSNCECKCDKSCDVGEYLDYENCKWRKKLVDKLVEECTETVEEVKLATITLSESKNKQKCSSSMLYIVLLSIIFTINIGIVTYFVYYKYLMEKMFLDVIMSIKQKIINTNGECQTNRDQKSNFLFLQRYDQSQKFWLKPAKNRQNALQRD